MSRFVPAAAPAERDAVARALLFRVGRWRVFGMAGRRHRGGAPRRARPGSLPGRTDRPDRSGAGPRHNGHARLPDRTGHGPHGDVEPPLRRSERARGGFGPGGARAWRREGSRCRDRRGVRRGARVGLGVGRAAPESRAGGRPATAGSAPLRHPLRHQQRPADADPPRRDRGRLAARRVERPDGLRRPRRRRGARRHLRGRTGLRGAPPVARGGHGRQHDRAGARGVGPQAGRPLARGGGAARGRRRRGHRGAGAARRRRSLQRSRGGHRDSACGSAARAAHRRRQPGRGAPPPGRGTRRDRGRRRHRIPPHRRPGDSGPPGRRGRRGAAGRNGDDRPDVPRGDSRRAELPASRSPAWRARAPCWAPAS